MPVGEECNGQDDDCDGTTDEIFDFTSDESNCGGCARSCGSGTTCLASECQESVCDDDADNDLDGQTDCSDRSCLGQVCVTPMPPSWRCGATGLGKRARGADSARPDSQPLGLLRLCFLAVVVVVVVASAGASASPVVTVVEVAAEAAGSVAVVAGAAGSAGVAGVAAVPAAGSAGVAGVAGVAGAAGTTGPGCGAMVWAVSAVVPSDAMAPTMRRRWIIENTLLNGKGVCRAQGGMDAAIPG